MVCALISAVKIVASKLGMILILSSEVVLSRLTIFFNIIAILSVQKKATFTVAQHRTTSNTSTRTLDIRVPSTKLNGTPSRKLPSYHAVPIGQYDYGMRIKTKLS